MQAQACFDDLMKDHPGRLPSDTYYVSRPGGREVSASTDVLLRTHTSAHQSQLLRDGKEAFLCTGDVYRRDEIDASHFPRSTRWRASSSSTPPTSARAR